MIKFDPEVFPLDDPQVIYLTEELPEIYQGSVIIDASDAGVILDGSLLDVTTSALFDNFEFKVNDRVIFLSTFDHDIEYWNKEDPEFWGTELAWNPAGMEENEGSLAFFVYMIFMPAFTDVDAMRQNDYLTIYIIGGVLALISGLLWAANKWCWFEKKEPVKADSERSEPSDPPASDQT